MRRRSSVAGCGPHPKSTPRAATSGREGHEGLKAAQIAQIPGEKHKEGDRDEILSRLELDFEQVAFRGWWPRLLHVSIRTHQIKVQLF